jgi:hypothetical protein
MSSPLAALRPTIVFPPENPAACAFPVPACLAGPEFFPHKAVQVFAALADFSSAQIDAFHETAE